MKNQDMPANPQQGFSDGEQSWSSMDVGGTGETKREKAFWQVYSAMQSSEIYAECPHESTANQAIEAVNAGFKALESDNE